MDTLKIDGLLSQMRSAAAVAAGKITPATPSGKIESDFSKVLSGFINEVNTSQQHAGALAKSFELGDPNVALHDVMISLQKANISFQTMIQVRNKLVSAYNDIMNMQI
jgi:flagellar hook-basal body complex protein FliE